MTQSGKVAVLSGLPESRLTLFPEAVISYGFVKVLFGVFVFISLMAAVQTVLMPISFSDSLKMPSLAGIPQR